MPKSKGPRKPYRAPDFRAEASRLREEAAASSPREKVTRTKINKPSEIPAAAHEAGPARAFALRPRYVVPVAAAGVGGGAYLLHRRRRNAVSKLIDPLSGRAVSFEETYDQVGKRGTKLRYDETAVEHTRNRRASNRRGALVVVRKDAQSRKQARRQYVWDERFSPFEEEGWRNQRKFNREHKSIYGHGPFVETMEDAVVGAGAGVGGAAGVGALRGARAHGRARISGKKTLGTRSGWAKQGARSTLSRKGALAGIGGAVVLSHVGQNRRRNVTIARLEEKGKIKKAQPFTPGGIITNVSTGRGHTWERGGTSHENKLLHVKHKPRQKPRGTLVHVVRKNDTVGSMFATSGRGSGRRLTSV